jgi:opacity protein-like surface antigen
MKHFILCCTLLFAFSAASAQGIGFGVHGNMINSNLNATLRQIVGVPPSTNTVEIALEEVYGIGWGGGLHFDVDLGLLAFRLSGDYVTLSPDQEKFKSLIQAYFPGSTTIVYVDGGKVDMYSGNVNAKLNLLPLPIFKIYATGGLGIASVKSTPANLKIGTTPVSFPILATQTAWTTNLGAGTDIKLGGLSLFAEIKFNWLFLKEGAGTSTMVPIATAGITF